jgi:hypothetical protein
MLRGYLKPLRRWVSGPKGPNTNRMKTPYSLVWMSEWTLQGFGSPFGLFLVFVSLVYWFDLVLWSTHTPLDPAGPLFGSAAVFMHPSISFLIYPGTLA